MCICSVCSWSFVFHLYICTDLCCAENDVYNIVDGGKVVYEEIAH